MQKRIRELIEKFKTEVLSPFIKTDCLDRFDWSGDKGSNSTDLKLCNSNQCFINSDYFFQESKEIIHFTSAESLIAIIESQQLRMSSLTDLEDLEEFNHAGRAMYTESELLIPNRKSRIYCFSACEANRLYDKCMWKDYGDKMHGVVLKLKIQNDPCNWQNYHFSKVYYDYLDKLDYYKKSKLDFEHSHDIKINLSLDRFLPFHKKAEFQFENEVRLTYFFDPIQIKELHPDELDEELLPKYHYLNLSNKFTNFKNLDQAILIKPKIEIVEIYLGPLNDNRLLIKKIEENLPEVKITNVKIEQLR